MTEHTSEIHLFAEKIQTRIAELQITHKYLSRHISTLMNAQIYHLEGNIGALEWVLKLLFAVSKAEPAIQQSAESTDPLRAIAEQMWGRLWKYPSETDKAIHETIERAMRLAIEATRQSFRQRTTGLYATDVEIAARISELLKAEKGAK